MTQQTEHTVGHPLASVPVSPLSTCHMELRIISYANKCNKTVAAKENAIKCHKLDGPYRNPWMSEFPEVERTLANDCEYYTYEWKSKECCSSQTICKSLMLCMLTPCRSKVSHTLVGLQDQYQQCSWSCKRPSTRFSGNLQFCHVFHHVSSVKLLSYLSHHRPSSVWCVQQCVSRVRTCSNMIKVDQNWSQNLGIMLCIYYVYNIWSQSSHMSVCVYCSHAAIWLCQAIPVWNVWS